jgi:anhydro-N-acetylmuramic acid kinase
MNHRFFIGLASGSSLFGVDAALVRVDGVGGAMTLGLEKFVHVPFGEELRAWLVRLTTLPASEMRHLGTLHRVLGETYALAVRQLVEQSAAAGRDVFAIGCPGVSIWHDAAGRYPATLQLGMMGVLAERSGLTVVSDFTERDLAVGGQGTPLTALVDALLFHHGQENRVLLHLGSVASVVWLPRDVGPNGRHLRGFQAAPCTILLDGLMRLFTNGKEQFDFGGKHGVQGRCLEPLVERWLQNHFFQEAPPRCVPRWEFGGDFLNRAIEQARRLEGNQHDVLCTMTHFVAQAIVDAIHRYLPAAPTRILLSGRGVRNGMLWRLLEQKLSPNQLEKTDAHGILVEARQAVAHAGLAALTLDGVPINVPAVTGASGARILGQLTPGGGDNWARCLAWMARRVAPALAAAA